MNTSVSEEVFCVAILKSEPPGEAGVLRSGADVDALRRIETVALDIDNSESREGLPAPTHRRAGAVWTVENLDGNTEQFLRPRETGVYLFGGQSVVRHLGPPR